MATIIESTLDFSGALRRPWPLMPRKIMGQALVGRKFIYTSDELEGVILGEDLPERPWLGEPLSTVTIVFVRGIYSSPGMDNLIRKAARDLAKPIVVVYSNESISISIGVDFDG